MTNAQWVKLVSKRLLLTNSLTQTDRHEWTLIEIAPSGKIAKFCNELTKRKFWANLDTFKVLDTLVSHKPPRATGRIVAARKPGPRGNRGQLLNCKSCRGHGYTVGPCGYHDCDCIKE